MSIKIFKLTPIKSYNLPSGTVFIMFKDDHLKQVSWELNRPLTQAEKQQVRAQFPFDINDLHNISLFNYQEIVPRTAHEKITHFCLYYKAVKGTPYTAKSMEKANIKDVVVNDALLATYFNNTSFPLSLSKSINDYIKHFNYVRDLAKNGTQKSKYPNEPNSQFERNLKPEELPAYWAHLRALGYQKNQRNVWVKVINH